ncbi:MAG: hypothetical protein ABW004_09495 [Aeromicrobium sp.]
MSGTDVLVFRTDPDTPLRRSAPWSGGVGAAAAAVALLGVVAGSPTIAVCAAVVVAVCLLVLCMAVSTIETVTIADGVVDHRRWTGRHVRIPIDGDLRGQLAMYGSAMPHSANTRRLVLRRGTRGPRITLSQARWSADQLDSMAATVGVDTLDGWRENRDWQQQAPGLVPWWERHWIVAFTAIAIGFWVVVIAILVVVDQVA